MANVEKFTRAAMGHMCAHFQRAKGEDGEYIRFGNQNIDTEKSQNNYNLAPEHEGGQVDFIRRRTSEVKCLNRADVNVMCSWVVTLPKGFEPEKEFFEATYQFLSDRYGKENVVSAYVHLDEKQPHMHFSFIPVTLGKNEKEKVSAKEVLTKMELQRFHPELQAFLERVLNKEVPILNGATAGGNRTVAELKADQEATKANESIQKSQQEALAAADMAQKAKDEVKSLEGEKKALKGEIKALKGHLLTAEEVASLHGQKTIGGGLKGVSYKEYESLKETALFVDKASRKIQSAEKKVATAEKRATEAEQRAEQALNERPSIVLQMENAEKSAKLERMTSRIQKLLKLLPEKFHGFIQAILHDREPVTPPKTQQKDTMKI